MAAKEAASSAGIRRKIANRKAAKNEAIAQHTAKKLAVADFLVKAAKPTKKKTR